MTREEVIRELQGVYEERRRANEAEHARRLREAIARDPEIEALSGADAALFRKQARILLADPSRAQEAIARAKEESARAKARLAERLTAAGFPPDYLQPVFACPLCRDTGFVGDPIKQRCACYERAFNERYYAGTGVGGQTFETFDESLFPENGAPEDAQTPIPQRQIALSARDKCLRYAQKYPDTMRLGFVLMGETGLGKTFLLNALEARLCERGFPTVKVTAYQAFDAMRGAHIGDEDRAREFDRLLHCPCLILDDLGSEPMMKNITVEYLFTLLNERLIQRLHTVIATNMTPNNIRDRYGERIQSRLLDVMNMEVARLQGRDLRQLPRKR